MNSRFVFFLVVSLCGLSAFGQSVKHDPGLVLWFDKPAEAWEEAMPLGNGTTGAMVFGGISQERYQLNDNTLWSGYPNAGNNPNGPKYLPLIREAVERGDYALAEKYWKKMQGPYSARYLHMANLFLEFPFEAAQAESYTRRLDLNTASSLVSFKIKGVTFIRESFISFPDKVMVVRLTASRKNSINLHAWMNSKLKYSVEPSSHDELILRGKAPMHVAHRNTEPLQVVYDESNRGEGTKFEIRLKVKTDGGSATQTDSSLRVSDADVVTLYISEATSFNGFDKSPGLEGRDASAIAALRMDESFKKNFEELRKSHVVDHSKLFHRVAIDLGKDPAPFKLPLDERMKRHNEGHADPGLESLYYQFGRYLLIACSRPGSPPANLQGMWNDHVQPPWGSNYTTNINTEMNYWHAESTNLSECHQPLLDFIGQLAINGKQTALINYGIADGWCAHHNTDIWAKTSPTGGYEWDPRGQARWACWPMSGAWFSTHLWEHYLYTGDKKFLMERAWPTMKGAAKFLIAWLVEGPDGHLVTNPSTSPENVFRIDGKEFQISMATTMDMAITRELFAACISAADVVGNEDGFRKQLATALERLYPYHIGQYGQLQEWFKDWDDPEDKHRHLSHLYGLHPGTHIGPETTPELAAAARQSLIHRGDASTGWSMAWKINWWARLLDGNRAYKILKEGLTLIDPSTKEAMTGGGTYPNLFDAHPPFQIDGNFGATAGITEMLMQSHGGEIKILPALPDAWKSGSFKGLKARGGFTIDAEWEAGKLTRMTIHSTQGGSCRVASPLRLKVLDTAFETPKGQSENPLMPVMEKPAFRNRSGASLPMPEERVFHRTEFDTEKGGSYTVVPI